MRPAHRTDPAPPTPTPTPTARGHRLGQALGAALRGGLAAATGALLVGCAGTPPPTEPLARGDFAAVPQRLQALIPQEMARAGVAGLSIALVDGPRLLWAQGFGWADAQARRPATADTLYRMGSVSKLFTATAALQLADQGRLDLDAPITRALPEFRIGSRFPAGPLGPARPQDAITLRLLLSHQAGLPRDRLAGMWWAADSAQGQRLPQDFREAVAALAQDELAQPPGLAVAYSNLGLDTVGLAVERVAGRPFEQQLQQQLLAPLGMASATFSAGPLDHPAMAQGHLRGQPRAEPLLRDLPAGGLTSSVSDLARFVQMLLADGRNGQGQAVLAPGRAAQMWQTQNAGAPLDMGFAVGLPWMLSSLGSDSVRGGGPVPHHGGATFFHRSQVMLLPEHGLGVVVAANDSAASDLVNRVAAQALAWLLQARTGQAPPPRVPGHTPAPRPWTDAERTACAGDYASLAGLARIRHSGGTLVAEVAGQRLALVEGDQGRLGLSPRLGWLPLPRSLLGPLAEMGLSCPQVAGRRLLVAHLDGTALRVGERWPEVLAPAAPEGLAPAGQPAAPATAALPPALAALVGRWRPELLPGEVPTLREVRVALAPRADGTPMLSLQATPTDAFGQDNPTVSPVQVLSAERAALPGTLLDTGPVVTRQTLADGEAVLWFSGWRWRRVREGPPP